MWDFFFVSSTQLQTLVTSPKTQPPLTIVSLLKDNQNIMETIR